VALLILAILLAARSAPGQVATGAPPYASFSGGPFDAVNNANLNVHFGIPVVQKAGRGLPFNYILSYDSSVWVPVGASGNQTWTPIVQNQTGGTNWGWRGSQEAYSGRYTYTENTPGCTVGGTVYYYDVYSNFTYYDSSGTSHSFNITTTNGSSQCGVSQVTSGTATATDGSGLTMSVTNYNVAVVYTPSGTSNVWSTNGLPPFTTVTDSNGNQVILGMSARYPSFIDTLNTTALITNALGSPPNPMALTYTAASGNQATVSVAYGSYTVQTNFGCSGVTEFGASSEYLVNAITLPDGTQYTFSYEVTPGDSHSPHYVTGRLASVTLPTGGTISYTYSGGSNGITCADGSTATLTRTTPDGAWTYAHTENGTAWTTTLTDPQGNQTTYNFQQVTGTPLAFETERQVAGLETIYTCYNGASFPCNSTSITLPITQRTVTTSIGGLESQVNTNYNSYGLPTEVDQYGYGSGAVGGLMRKATTAYNTSLNNNIVNRPSTVSVYNGSGTLLRQNSYSYDGSSLTSTSGTPQHTNPSGSRGNLTSLTVSGYGFGSLSMSITYYDTGDENVVTDFNGAQITHNSGQGACGNSFDTTLSLSLSLSQSLAWECNGALKTSTSDYNANNSTFAYDNLNRLTQTTYPNTGSSIIQYTSATVQDSCTLISGSVTGFCTPTSGSVARHDQTVLDGLGRTIHQDLVSDPSGETYVDSTYDSLGRLYTRSNPYRSTSDPTYGQNTYSYDALGRQTKIAHTDGSYSQTSYGSGTQACSASTYGYGYPALYTDESGNQRQTFTDALGRVIEVDEPNPGSGNSLTWNACYAYDAQGNLTSVVQGNETRSYGYDGLSQLTQSTTPEGGTTYYYYTTSGGALCANNQQLACRKTDARGITTTYTYDALDRLTGKSYSNGDPSVTYYYDQTSYNGLTITNGKGRRTGMSDGSGQTAWSYNTMGRIVTEQRTIGSVTKTISYTYNLNGSLASITYPSGRVLSYTYGNDGRAVSVVDSANNINYATGATYAPQGRLASVVYGQVSGGFAGITRSNSYNNRLLPTLLSASSSNGAALSLSYTYFANRNVNVETNGRDTGRSVTYTYDALDRVSTATSQATSGSDCWGQSFGYDRYANLTTINVTQCTALMLSLSVNTNNQITSSGFTYDAAGDLTGDGVYTYSWNAEQHLNSAANVTYTYDGDLQRVEKSSGTLYWYCAVCGNVLAESDLSGDITSEYALFNRQRVARRDVSSGNVYYIFSDHLGSYRTLTDSSGNVKGESDYYPFGAERVISSTVTDNFRFAGMEWDSEDGLNHTPHRKFAPALGRWQSPDPKRGRVNFPQGLNLYSYVRGNPTNNVDPLGLELCPPGCDFVEDEGPGYCDCVGAVDQGGQHAPLLDQTYGAGPGANNGCPSGTCSINQIINLVHTYNDSGQPDCLIDCLIMNESHIGNNLSQGFNPSAYNSKVGATGLMQVTLVATEQAIFGGPPANATQWAVANEVYNDLIDPALNISVGSDYLRWAIGAFGGVQGGLMQYTNNNTSEVSDVQNCASILKPGDPTTYQAAFAAATK
jgi:RHS repeat-associated protein